MEKLCNQGRRQHCYTTSITMATPRQELLPWQQLAERSYRKRGAVHGTRGGARIVLWHRKFSVRSSVFNLLVALL